MYKIIGGDQKEYGPVSFDQLASWVRDNRANAQTLVQREGGPWVPLGSIPEFAALLPIPGSPGAGTSATPPIPEMPGTASSLPTFSTGAPIGGGGSLPPGGGFSPAGGFGGDGQERARQMVQGPAIALLVTGIISVLLGIVGIIGNAVGAQFQPNPADFPPEMRQFFDAIKGMQGPAAIVSSLVHLAVSGLAIFGAIKMRKLENFTLVVTANVLMMVPCTASCCCVVGLPVGIWALVVLFKPEVKSAFR